MTTDPFEILKRRLATHRENERLADERRKHREHLYAWLHQAVHRIYRKDPFRTVADNVDVRVTGDGKLLFVVRICPTVAGPRDTENYFQLMKYTPGCTWEALGSRLYTMSMKTLLETVAVIAGSWLFEQGRVNASNDS